ncbi:hypothetical protein IPJ70_01560 [Candidatus Campbellbacteria bacterium]|nr:MAG: hypothetical protein IPJ70_01560 [Candidatus Campbellbacteria bacterium]
MEADILFKDKNLLKEISWFIEERNNIWKRKIIGEKPPYTKNPILSTYRFCNIFREFDRQTIEFHELLNPIRNNFPLWLLNMFYCRMVARTTTVTSVGLLSFDQKENIKLYEGLMASPRPRFGTPYVFPISVIQKSNTPTREKFISQHLPTVIKLIAKEIATWKHKSVYDGVEIILPLFKYNLRFLWTEVLIDISYQFPQYINLFGRFPIGPGSAPTMRRINPAKDPTLLVKDLSLLPINTDLTFNRKQLRLSAENWEGIGCEYRKYTNLKAGRGRRRIYKPTNLK